MKYLFDNSELCQNALNKINANMGYDGVTQTHDVVTIINNPDNVDYNKAYIEEVGGDESHHSAWLEGVTGYTIVEYDFTWILQEEF